MNSGIWRHDDGAVVEVKELPRVEVGADDRCEVWLAPRAAGGPRGRGTAESPILISGPHEFDAVLRDTVRKPRATHANGLPGVRFRLTAGRFHTRGTWAYETQSFAMLRGSDELVGDGSGRTSIELVEPILQTNGVQRPDANVLWVSSPYRDDGYGNRVSGIKLLSAHPLTTCGLRIHTRDVQVDDVVVQGAHGSYDLIQGPSGKIQYEAFGISFSDRGTGTVSRSRVVQRFPKSYLSAFSAGLGRARFDDCHAEGMWEEPGHAAFTVYINTVISACTGSGYSFAIYNDTSDVLGCRVSDSDFTCAYAAISIAAKPGTIKRGLRVRNCGFAYLPAKGSTTPYIGLQLRGKEGQFRSIDIADCWFETDSKGRKFYLGSTDAPDLQMVQLRNLVVPQGALMDFMAGHRMKLAEVVDWSGTPGVDHDLPVKGGVS